MSHLGLTVRNDDTVNLLVSKVNDGTINFADGVDAVEAQTILSNYVQFVALSIESFNRGEIDLVNFPTIEQYNNTVQVVINLGTEVFSVLEFAQTIQAAAPAEKQSKLTDCLTNITQL
jgi:ribonucleotide reductase alpha subunit